MRRHQSQIVRAPNDGSQWKQVKDSGEHMYGELAEPLLASIEPGASICVNEDLTPEMYEWQPAYAAGDTVVAGLR